MTAIISWLNMEDWNNPSIWTIWDTMISKNGGALTLLWNKILELPIKCKDITTLPQEYYFSWTIWFAYAGSTLIGMNVYTFLVKILSNLGWFKSSNHLPDALSICKKAEEILKIYIESISDLAEIMIFGTCPKNNNPFICTIKARNSDTIIDYKFTFKDKFSSSLEVMHIWSEYEEIIKMIDAKSDKNKKVPIKYWRTPKEVIEEIIKLENIEMVKELQHIYEELRDILTKAVSSEIKY